MVCDFFSGPFVIPFLNRQNILVKALEIRFNVYAGSTHP